MPERSCHGSCTLFVTYLAPAPLAAERLPMHIRRNALLGCIVLLAIISRVAGIAQAQNVVPPTAVQAAKMPQFASRLAHPTRSQTTIRTARSHRGPACSQMRLGSPQDNGAIYANGATNGNTDAWTINFGFIVSDSFNVIQGNGTSINGMTFAAWLFPGDTMTSAQVSVTSSPFGGTTYFNQTVNFTQNGCVTNSYGYSVCLETSGAFTGLNLNNGAYWVNLQNASVPSGDPVYWDENSGPSSASQNEVGTIPSESFTILGNTTTSNSCMPEQSGSFAVIHDFNGTDGASPSGVAIDPSGNLYGPAQAGGSGYGTVFKLAETGSNWLLNTLYKFIGGASGGSPGGVIVGRNGILYGASYGGIQNCQYGEYCGSIFGLRPSPTACLTALCSWTENALYSFTGPTDAWAGSDLVFDQAGNLYGVSEFGGAQGKGAVFELRPSIGGWIEGILYSFTGGSDGGGPSALLLGNDGNLYGMAGTGGTNGSGVVFELMASGSGWNEVVVSNLPYSMYPTGPHNLIQDNEGNLFGEWDYWYEEPEGSGETLGVIFELSPSNGNWIYTELHRGVHEQFTNDIFINLALDGAGNLWGTGGGAAGCVNPVLHGYIFELARTSGGWQFSQPVYWNQTDFDVSGDLALDAHGNLYGTTSDCGVHQQGTVWEFTTQ